MNRPTRRALVVLAVLAVAVPVLLVAGGRGLRSGEGAPSATTAATATGPAPLAFERNDGQFDPRARYVARLPGGAAFVTASGAVLALPADPAAGLPAAAIGLRVVGGREAEVEGLQPLPGVVNYLIGSDRSRWRRHIPTYARVEAHGLLPGAGLAFYGAEGGLEYDVALAPGVDPASVRIAFDGADRVELTAGGDLRIAVGARELLQRRPLVYQEVDGQRRQLGAAYVVERGGEVAVRVEGRDPSRALVIDPVVVWSTYLSGALNDWVADVADGSGDLLAVGRATSLDFPTTTGVLARNFRGGTSDCFVTRLAAGGKGPIVSTYLGGAGSDECRAVVSLGSTGVIVAGVTDSFDFPTKSGAFQLNPGGSTDGFVGLLLPDLSDRSWMTYLGGTGAEFLRGARLSNQGDVLVWGSTASANFPATPGTVGTALNGLSDGFIAAFSSATGNPSWATLLGGNGDESIAAIRQNTANVIFAVGYTTSTFVPWTSAFNPAGHPDGDAFIARISSDGKSVFSFDFIGGTGHDEALGLGMDINNNTCVAGVTQSPGTFPVSAGGPAQPAFGGGTNDGFLVVLNGTMTVQASTYLGGSGDDAANACGFDSSGDVWAAGSTISPNFPGASGSGRLFYSRTSASLGRAFSSALTGGSDFTIQLFAVRDLGGDLVYAGGTPTSLPFPITPGAYQPASSAQTAGYLLALRTYPFSTQVAPAVVSSVAGGNLTFTGNNWTPSPRVDLCSTGTFVPCTVVDATHLSCPAAPHAPAACTPRLEYTGTPSGYILSAFSYAAPPVVTAVNPSSGGGGDQVTVAGTGFVGGAFVRFGGADATAVVATSATQLTCTVPAHALGPVTVEVQNTDGLAGGLANAFTYTSPGGGPGTPPDAPTNDNPYACGHAGGGFSFFLALIAFAWLLRRRPRAGLLALAAALPLAASAADKAPKPAPAAATTTSGAAPASTATPAPRPRAKAKVAVLPVKVAVGLEPRLGDVITDALVSAVQGRGVPVVSTREIEGMLGFERQKQMLGCAEDTSCLAEIGGALGVDGVVMASVARVGDTLTFSAQRLDARKGVVVGRSMQRLKGGKEEALLEAADIAAAELFPEGSGVATGEPPPPKARARPSSAPAEVEGRPGEPALLLGAHGAYSVGEKGGAAGLDCGWRFSERIELVGSLVVTGSKRPAVELRLPWTLLNAGGRWRGQLVPLGTVILGGDSTLFGLGLGAAAEWAFSRSGLLRFELPVVKVKNVDGVTVLPTVALAFAL